MRLWHKVRPSDPNTLDLEPDKIKIQIVQPGLGCTLWQGRAGR